MKSNQSHWEKNSFATADLGDKCYAIYRCAEIVFVFAFTTGADYDQPAYLSNLILIYNVRYLVSNLSP